ncbi:MAG: acyltransferase [Spirosomataceae bacterium]
MKRIPTFDGLRGFAILLVLYDHCPKLGDSFVANVINHMGNVWEVGYWGVECFFALSGYLITSIYLHDKQQDTFSVKRFYIKRFLRIFPVYYLAILVVALVLDHRFLGYLLTYTSNFLFAFELSAHPLRQTWSLAVEEHFYLVFPWLMHYVSVKKLVHLSGWLIPLSCVVAAILTTIYVVYPLSFDLIYRATPYRLFSISMGVFIALNYVDIKAIVDKYHRWLWIIWIIVILLCPFLYKFFFPHRPYAVYRLIWFGILGVLTLLNTIPFRSQANVWMKLLSWPVLQFIGKISYGIYLVHYPIYYVFGLSPMQTSMTTQPLLVLWAILISIALATVSYYLIEKPILRWKDHL